MQNILLIGILGICGLELKEWDGVDIIMVGSTASIVARGLHFGYSSLQKKLNPLFIQFSSDSKLVMNVETEVVRRLNAHRKMRRVLGYMVMLVYYISNIYYSFKFFFDFDSNQEYSWFIGFLFGVGFEIFVLEPGKIYLQIEAANYLKVGGSDSVEAICRVFADEEFAKTFD
jgi:hypothetical protein